MGKTNVTKFVILEKYSLKRGKKATNCNGFGKTFTSETLFFGGRSYEKNFMASAKKSLKSHLVIKTVALKAFKL